jgi:hypothetical protein
MQNNFAVWCRTILLASSASSSKEALARRRPRSYSPACIEHAPAADGCHAMSSRKHYHRAGDTACASEGMNAEQALTRNAQERRASARRGTSYDHCAVRIEGCSANVEPTTDSGGRQPAVVRVTHRQRRACLSERETRVAQLAYARHSWSRERVPLLICVSDRRVRYVCHGRLTPTALGARRYVPSGNSAICAAQTHMHKSGGRQPAVVRHRTTAP